MPTTCNEAASAPASTCQRATFVAPFQLAASDTSGPARREGAVVALAASWNGATNVARWQVRVGRDARSLRVVGTYASTGFETAMPLRAAGAVVVQVQALGAAGRVLGVSAVTTIR